MGKWEMRYGSTLEQRALGKDIDQQWIRENESRELEYGYDDIQEEKEEVGKILEGILMKSEETSFEDVKKEIDSNVDKLIRFLQEKEEKTGYKYTELINDAETFRNRATATLKKNLGKREFIEIQFEKFDASMRKRTGMISKFIKSAITCQSEHLKLHRDYVEVMNEEVNLPNKQAVIVFFDKLCMDFQNIDFKNYQTNHVDQLKEYVTKFHKFVDNLNVVVNITERLDEMEKDNPELAGKVVTLREELGNKLINLQSVDRNAYMTEINNIVSESKRPQEEKIQSKDVLIKKVIGAMLDAGKLSSLDRDGSPDMGRKLDMIREAKKRLSMLDEDLLELLLNKYNKDIEVRMMMQQAEKMVEDMANGKIDTNGQPIVENLNGGISGKKK